MGRGPKADASGPRF